MNSLSPTIRKWVSWSSRVGILANYMDSSFPIECILSLHIGNVPELPSLRNAR